MEQAGEMEIDGIQRVDPQLLAFRHERYKTVESAIAELCKIYPEIQPDDRRVIAVDVVNEEIKSYNAAKNLPTDQIRQGIIELSTILEHNKVLTDTYTKLDQDPTDPDREQKYRAGCEAMQVYLRSHGYPEDWYVKPEMIKQWAVEAQRAQQQQRTLGGILDEQQRSFDAQLDEQTAANLGRPKWPKGMTADGDHIVAYWQLHRGTRCIVEIKRGGKFIYEIRSGSECGLVEVETYKTIEGVYKLNAAPRKKWTYRDRDNFLSVWWAASAQYKTHREGSNYRAPDTECFVQMRDDNYLMRWSDLVRLIGATSARSAVGRCCARDGTLAPWVSKKSPQTIVRRGDLTSTAASHSSDAVNANSTLHEVHDLQAQSSENNTTSSQEDISLGERMSNLERQISSLASVIERLQPSPSVST